MNESQKLEFKALCPQCGGSLSFSTQATIFAVCPYCRSTLSRDAETVQKIGQIGTLLEDYSRIQVGSHGELNKKPFTVVGRAQMRYKYGYWNEWYLVFTNGTGGWLSDASGQYTITTRIDSHQIGQSFAPSQQGVLPEDFTQRTIGSIIRLYKQEFIASDKRTCQTISLEGELPYTPSLGAAYVIDYRAQNEIITLDYSQGSPPVCYHGQITDLTSLNMRNLRSEKNIIDTSGRALGKLLALECPNCSHAISIVGGLATQVVCPSCKSSVDFSDETGKVIAKSQQSTSWTPALPLGHNIKWQNNTYTILGVLLCEDPESSDYWEEYLCFHATNGFLWLIHNNAVWLLGTVCNDWPTRHNANEIAYKKEKYFSQYPQYESKIVGALGSFNWQPKIGDVSLLSDFHNPRSQCLSMEQSQDELTWTHTTKLTDIQFREITGLSTATTKYLVANSYANTDDDIAKRMRPLYTLLFVLAIILVIWIIYEIFDDDDDDNNSSYPYSSSSWGSSRPSSWGGFGHK